MNSFKYLLFCLVVLLHPKLCSCQNCSAQEKGDKKEVLKINVGDKPTGSLDIGIGWNEATCLEGRWVSGDFSIEDWDRYFGLMEWSGCHWLRHAVTISDWEPENDNDDPQKTEWTKLAFDSEKMKRHYIFFDQAEKRGIKVLVTNWRLGTRWMTNQDKNWILAHPDSNEEFAEAIAALIYHLKVHKKYQCIWALSLWNEPNGTWAYTGPKSNYPETFWPLYLAVDRQLRRLGIRDDIQLLGPDTSTGGKPEHILEMLARYGSILDIICDHDYSAFRGEKMDKSIAAYSKLIEGLRRIPGKEMPFVIGEFGNYGAGSQAVDVDSLVYDGALSTTEYLIRMLNNGVAGLARWEFHIYGDTWRNFGALTQNDPVYIFKPYGPVYYIHSITSRYVKPGWKVMETSISDDPEGIFSTVLSSPDNNNLTIIILNDKMIPVRVKILIDKSLNKPVLHHMSVSRTMPEGIELHENILTEDGTFEIMLLPRSVSTITSLPVGDLSLPARLSLKR